MKTLAINDEVSLRSPNLNNKFNKIMIVKDISYTTDKILCIWQDDKNIFRSGLFSSNSLRKHKKTTTN